MTQQEKIVKIVEENDIVAAECCGWCEYYRDIGDDPKDITYGCQGKCSLLGIPTYNTDVCKHFNGHLSHKA